MVVNVILACICDAVMKFQRMRTLRLHFFILLIDTFKMRYDVLDKREGLNEKALLEPSRCFLGRFMHGHSSFELAEI